jgi:hypothetical protein
MALLEIRPQHSHFVRLAQIARECVVQPDKTENSGVGVRVDLVFRFECVSRSLQVSDRPGQVSLGCRDPRFGA